LPEELIEKAKNKFIEIQEAYEELEKKLKKWYFESWIFLEASIKNF
jgi:DnaJ-class molecular chaperone